jgi:phosphohistidine phosphatase
VQLYLVQHGQAKSEEEDPDRPLTDKGAADVAQVARLAIGELGVRPARVVHSGKTRARQTAEVWGRLLELPVEQSDSLAPNDDPATWVERLRTEGDVLLLVGHLPHLERLAGTLLSGDAGSSRITFRPGGLVGLERTDGRWAISLALPVVAGAGFATDG